jgi:plastocyanin
MLAIAGLLLCGALIAGCASTNYGTGTTAPTSSVTGAQTTAAGGAGQAVALSLTAQNIKFDKSTLTVPAGSSVTITFTNNDSGVPHNFALYTDASAGTTIYKGAIVNGPGTTKYTFTAPSTPGTYFFRCDVHPTQMTGSFIVQ